jgi:DnaJ like chaperone protein
MATCWVKATDDAATVKRAYRKLMSEHHPDKLVAKGLPPDDGDGEAESAGDPEAWS